MKEEEKEKRMPQNALLESWIKASTDFWKFTASAWPAAFGGTPPVSGSDSKEKEDVGVGDPMKILSEIWQALFKLVNEPMTGEFHPASSFSEWILKASQSLWSGYDMFQKQWIDEEKFSEAREGYARLSQKMTKAWLEMYGKEFGQILNIPQLGLTRFYQERANQTIEKFILFQGTLTEFVQYLFIPMEKASLVVQEEIKNLEKQGKETLKDPKPYYQMWIRILEGNYMTVLKSDEFTEKLGKTMKALRDYRVTRLQFLMDILQDLPIPTNKDMDELSKDLYLLKKRVKELEKKVKNHGR